jgi:hypothetical protein
LLQGDVLLWHKENGVETLDAVSYIEMLEGEVTRLRQQLGQQLQQQQQQQSPALPVQPAQQKQQAQQPFSALQQPMLTDGRQLPVPMSPQSALQVRAGRIVVVHCLLLKHTLRVQIGAAGVLLLQTCESNSYLSVPRLEQRRSCKTL